ncbi:MAG: hypothetical protein H6578_07920 [Chitinophagales bacterium]|nr:hypothetical protein [Chitinophagales bacterium]
MGLIASIKSYFYNSTLNKHAKYLKNYGRKVINLNNAKNIGLLYNASNSDNVVAVTKFIELFKNNDVKITSLAYLNEKIKEDSRPNYFNKNDINWYEIPFGEKINNFQKEKYDILICATVQECLPLEYLSATSKASYRVGSYQKDKTEIYDFMINVNQQTDLNYFFKQVYNYLKNIES